MSSLDVVSATDDDEHERAEEAGDALVAFSLGGSCIAAMVAWIGFLGWVAGRLLSFW